MTPKATIVMALSATIRERDTGFASSTPMVLLPEPEGPMMATYSFDSMSSEIPRSACTLSAPIS